MQPSRRADDPSINQTVPVFSMGQTLKRYCRFVPMALAIREAERAREFSNTLASSDSRSPNILDLGCGDGVWWSAFRDTTFAVYGVDLNPSELALANQAFRGVLRLDISEENAASRIRMQLHWPKKFQIVIGNCSMEHIPNLRAALKNAYDLTAPGGRFLLFVPTPDWAHHGLLMHAIMKRYPRIGMTISGAVNGFFQHWHLMHFTVWQSLLEAQGFTHVKIKLIGSRRADFGFRFCLPFSFPSFLCKQLFGAYPNRFLPERLTNFFANVIHFVFLSTDNNRPLDREDSAHEYAIECTRPK